MPLSVPGKVLCRIILARLRTTVDDTLRDNQANFHRESTDQIATLRITAKQSIEWNSSLYANFMDFEKTFDSLDRETFWELMRHYAIPEKFVILIHNTCEGMTCKVSLLARPTLALSFLLESGRDVFYDHFCSFWL